MIRAVQTRPKPDNLAKPPNDNPIPAQTEGPVGRSAGFYSQKPTLASRVAGSHLQNPSNPTRLELKKNLTKSCKNKPDLALSSGI